MSDAAGSPKQIGAYTIVRELGRGGMGIVYLATQAGLERPVALKVLSPDLAGDATFVERFHHEAGILARVDSPHIIAIYDHGQSGRWLYLATQYVAGGDLATYVRSRSRLDPTTALAVFNQILWGLKDAHSAGVLHRDVKPSNILLRADRSEPYVYLCDFGIAQADANGMTQTGVVAGSVNFMAPERHEGKPATARSDIYSAACVLWVMLTGNVPYSGTEFQVATGHMTGPIPQLPGSGPRIAHVNRLLSWCLAKNPADRPLDADEALNGVANAAAPFVTDRTVVRSAVLADTVPGPQPGPPPPPATATLVHTVARPPQARPADPPPERKRRKPLVAAAIALAVALVAAGVVLVAWPKGSQPQVVQAPTLATFPPLASPELAAPPLATPSTSAVPPTPTTSESAMQPATQPPAEPPPTTAPPRATAPEPAAMSLGQVSVKDVGGGVPRVKATGNGNGLGAKLTLSGPGCGASKSGTGSLTASCDAKVGYGSGTETFTATMTNTDARSYRAEVTRTASGATGAPPAMTLGDVSVSDAGGGALRVTVTGNGNGLGAKLALSGPNCNASKTGTGSLTATCDANVGYSSGTKTFTATLTNTDAASSRPSLTKTGSGATGPKPALSLTLVRCGSAALCVNYSNVPDQPSQIRIWYDQGSGDKFFDCVFSSGYEGNHCGYKVNLGQYGPSGTFTISGMSLMNRYTPCRVRLQFVDLGYYTNYLDW